MNKTAEAWNALAKDDEELECSDDLKSAVSSLGSLVDVVVPRPEGSGGQFGAQTSVFVESQDVVVLSTGSSHELEPQPIITTRSSHASSSKKRHLESTPEQSSEPQPNKRASRSSRTSTPRLRHDNSQIQFEPIPDSSSKVEESQHFTDRQREIRERQMENAVAYADIHSTSPREAVDASSSHAEEVQPPPKQRDVPAETTPEKASTYQELISSTPTPRRGQFIPMEADNDPPSSPPEPRPYPLLSEIRSRSRASSSMDDWDFSSPPSSPVTSRQQVAHDGELPHITLTDDSTQPKAATPTKSKKARGRKTPAQVTSSNLLEVKSKITAKQKGTSAPDAPKTPQRSGLGTRASESPKSGDDEFVDARTEVERSSPIHESGLPDKDTSFALSEGDESRMMKFIVELESRECNSALHGHDSSSVPKVLQECITVRAESEDEEGKGNVSEPLHAIIPSTPMDESAESSGSSKRKKRKRESKIHESRRKKRKSAEKTDLPSLQERNTRVSQRPMTRASRRAEASASASVPSPGPASESPSGVRTRRSARKELERQRMAQTEDHRDERDTDEELMSQIIGESYAASQSQQDNTQESEPVSIIEDSFNTGSFAEEAIETKPEPEMELETPETSSKVENKADYILGFLKGGVETLQDASLSRQEVNKIEDALMDLKRALYAAEERGRKSRSTS